MSEVNKIVFQATQNAVSRHYEFHGKLSDLDVAIVGKVAVIEQLVIQGIATAIVAEVAKELLPAVRKAIREFADDKPKESEG